MSIYSIGVSGLNAAQSALYTTSNNISNVYTPGYNRELVILGENQHGGGVQVNDIQRQYDAFVAVQLNASTSASSALGIYQAQISQIDNLLADGDAGLAPLMQNFFSALGDLAAFPSDPAARQSVLGAADTLSAQFRAFDGYLQDMQSGVNQQIVAEVDEINTLTQQIAQLNHEIVIATARYGQAPNALLNQRDHLVAELSTHTDFQLVVQDGGSYNINLPGGQPLVTGTHHYELEAVASPYDPQRTVVGYRDAAGNLVILPEDAIQGGALGGLMSFRAESLDKTQNQIGQLAVSLVVGFNDQHRLGQDLNGEQGQDFFSIGQPQAYAHVRNEGSAQIADTGYGDVSQLAAADYTVRVTAVDGATGEPTFQIVRKDNGQVVEHDFEDGTLSFAGVELTFDDGGFAVGDSYEIQPVRRAAGGVETLISDPAQIAAGSFLETSGDMAISSIVAAQDALQDAPDGGYALSLDSEGNLGTGGVPVERNGQPFDPDNGQIEPGDVLTVDGISFSVDALPAEGETASLTLDAAPAAAGDNRNALALQELQNVDLVAGNATLNQAYASIVSDVGNQTNVVQANLQMQQGLTDQLRAVQQSVSGVNLDEEAANLIRYQQYYQANARVIETASTMFDTILGLRT
ncbi:flagellar hook-associated protein FlgK [Halomonas sp. BC1]|uniref:flagellar hook-associated protein FlgK n=1 Tax=Halomonas sp. BC1 TaxID=1670448 RepID=UPI0009C134CE|nr:flagellar hook-associated protein FlgK [Halomonas sp. BC1]